MISVANIKSVAQAVGYYDRDDYYSSDQSPSNWYGLAAEEIGLKGRIDRDDFARAVDGFLPGEARLPRAGTDNRRVGCDLTFSASKSVSLAALVGGDKRIIDAHRRAVSKALDWLEENSAAARITENGKTREDKTSNLVIARFDHDVSRGTDDSVPDPHLHTHALVMATKRSDGQWRAVSNERLYQDRKLADAVYRAELAAELQKLGYGLEMTSEDGRFEIAGIDREQIEAFSKRHMQIEEILEKKGLSGARASAWASDSSRKVKKDVERGLLLGAWREQAQEVGLDLSAPDPQRPPSGVSENREHRRRVLLEKRQAAQELVAQAIAHCSERDSVFTKRDLLRFACEKGVGVVTLDFIQEKVEEAVEQSSLYDLGDDRLTTPEAVSQELYVMKSAREGRGILRPIVDRDQVRERVSASIEGKTYRSTVDLEAVRAKLGTDPEKAPLQAVGQTVQLEDGRSGKVVGLDAQAGQVVLEHQVELTAGQRAAAELVLSTQDQIVGIQGYAGVGKTFSLDIVRKVAEEAGYEVTGASNTAAAAALLEEDANIKSKTVAALLLEKNRVVAERPKPQLWVIDEASMIGSKDASKLMAKARREGAQVVLVGDEAQIPAIAAGKPFSQLMAERKIDYATVDEILRQKDFQLKEAVEMTIAGDDLAALKALEKMEGAIQQIEDRDERLQAVAEAYLENQESSMIITGTNRDRRDINDLVRTGLKERGQLSGAATSAEILVPKSMTEAELKNSRSYREGDVVRFGRAYKSMGIESGEYLMVARASDGRGIVELQASDGRKVEWKPLQHSRVEAFERGSRELQVGDEIRFTRNDKDSGRRNGDRARVLEVDEGRSVAKIQVQTKRGPSVQTLELGSQKHWEYSYCSTIFASQGQSVDQVLVHMDTSSRTMGKEAWYVAISRGKNKATIFSDDVSRIPDAISRSMIGESALEALKEREESVARETEKGRGVTAAGFSTESSEKVDYLLPELVRGR